MNLLHEMNITQKTQLDQKQECGICTGVIFNVLCASCKLCSRIHGETIVIP